MSIFVIAEIGINHNGDIDLAKKMIDVSVKAGADAVKFQKRDIESVYSKELLDLILGRVQGGNDNYRFDVKDDEFDDWF